MGTQLDLVPIFPAAFASGAVDGYAALNTRLAPLLLARRDEAFARDSAPRGAMLRRGSYEGAADLFDSPDPSLQALKREMLEAVGTLVAEVGGYDAAELESLRSQARTWLTVVEPGYGLPIRSHPMASWCAIYCVQAPDAAPERPNAGALSLYDPRLGNMYLDAGNARMRMPFGYGHFATRPIAGQLLVFPAHLQHEIMPLRGATPLVAVNALFRFVTIAPDVRL